MLLQLTIQNYATVDSLEIEFKAGMSVITGETGAGKSVIVGALGLALGDRADKAIIRSGARRAEICAEFNTANILAAQNWLAEHDLEAEDASPSCLLRRVVNDDGRSRGYINGSPVTLSNLKSLGEMLINIHSQHEHQSLLHRATHQRLLDEYCVKGELLSALRGSWKQWQANFQLLQSLSSQSEEDSAQWQLLSYQLSELDELDIGVNEAADLDAEFKTLNHADETLAATARALNLCSENEDHNVSSLLAQALAVLHELPEKQADTDSIIGLLENADIQLQEAASELRDFGAGFDANPQRLEQVNARLSALHAIARKHKVHPNALPEVVASLRQQLTRLQNTDEELEKLTASDQKLRNVYKKVASKISVLRRRGGEKLAQQVNAQLKLLGMPNAALAVTLQDTASENPVLHGLESVEFLVSTNPGQAAKPLIKIASGGELSRISLAIQVITAQTSQTPSLVFDEVDVGIGGGVAKIVGELLRQLGSSTQILCVTHQAQVAGQGHHHLFVSKRREVNSSLTEISELTSSEKIKEVARMLGGEEYSVESLAHAEQMVASN
jgi:DNA repair protein RecN (Recombination protein N)